MNCWFATKSTFSRKQVRDSALEKKPVCYPWRFEQSYQLRIHARNLSLEKGRRENETCGRHEQQRHLQLEIPRSQGHRAGDEQKDMGTWLATKLDREVNIDMKDHLITNLGLPSKERDAAATSIIK